MRLGISGVIGLDGRAVNISDLLGGPQEFDTFHRVYRLSLNGSVLCEAVYAIMTWVSPSFILQVSWLGRQLTQELNSHYFLQRYNPMQGRLFTVTKTARAFLTCSAPSTYSSSIRYNCSFSGRRIRTGTQCRLRLVARMFRCQALESLPIALLGHSRDIGRRRHVCIQSLQSGEPDWGQEACPRPVNVQRHLPTKCNDKSLSAILCNPKVAKAAA